MGALRRVRLASDAPRRRTHPRRDEDIEYLGQGESSFIRKDLADVDAVGAFLKQLVRPQRADAAAKPGDETA
jgi:hypothetical protein